MKSAWEDELDEIFEHVDDDALADAHLALDIAVQFAALRERRGLSQRALAARLGRTQHVVSRIENPTFLGFDTLLAITLCPQGAADVPTPRWLVGESRDGAVRAAARVRSGSGPGRWPGGKRRQMM